MSGVPRGPTTFAIWGPIARDDLPGLCDRVCALMASDGSGVLVCEVGSVPANAVTVDALARLQLAARRNGCEVRMRGATDELRELIAFMGLSDVVPE